MSLDALTASLKAKTLPLRWWKLVMVLKALTAPVIGAILWWIILEFIPTAPINLSNRLDQVTTIVISLVTTAIAGLSAYFWYRRKEDRFTWFLSMLFCTCTGGLASIVIYQITHSYSY